MKDDEWKDIAEWTFEGKKITVRPEEFFKEMEKRCPGITEMYKELYPKYIKDKEDIIPSAKEAAEMQRIIEKHAKKNAKYNGKKN